MQDKKSEEKSKVYIKNLYPDNVCIEIDRHKVCYLHPESFLHPSKKLSEEEILEKTLEMVRGKKDGK